MRRLRLALALAAAACGSTTTTPGHAHRRCRAGEHDAEPAASTAPVAATAARVGADCAMIPAKGKGSVGSLSTQQAIAAASSNPQLSVFIAAMRTAGLDKTLNSRL